MPRFIIKQDRAVWHKEFYAVDAADAEEAEEKFNEGESDFLGFSTGDNVEHLSADEPVDVEQMDEGLPFMAHPFDEPEPKPIKISICVEGGIVQGVRGTTDMAVSIFDIDDAKDADDDPDSRSFDEKEADHESLPVFIY